MKKQIHMVGLVLATAVAASAATYTVTTTAGQETKLTRARAVLNASGAGYADNNAMVLDLCTTRLRGLISDLDDADATALANLARNWTQAQRDAACAAAGNTVVGGRCQ